MATVALLSGDQEAFGELPALLQRAGHRVLLVEEPGQLPPFGQKYAIDVLVMDIELAGVTPPGQVTRMRERCPDAAIVAVAGAYSRELDLRLRTRGIVHLAIKPLDPAQVADVILHCLEHKRRVPGREV